MGEMTIQSLVNSALLLLLQIAVVSGLILLKRWKLQMEAYYAKQTTVQQRELLALVGNEAFHYAEQVFAQHDGPAKLNEAVKYVLDRATSHRLQVTYPEVRAVIEKAWAEFEIQKSQKQAA